MKHQDVIGPVGGHDQKAGNLTGGEIALLNELLANIGSLCLRSGFFYRLVSDGNKVSLLFESAHVLNENSSVF